MRAAGNWACSLRRISNGSYIVAYVTDSNDGDASGHHGADDAWVVKLDSNSE